MKNILAAMTLCVCLFGCTWEVDYKPSQDPARVEKAPTPKRLNVVAWRTFTTPGPVSDLVISIITDTLRHCEYVVFQATEGGLTVIEHHLDSGTGRPVE